MPTNFKLKGNRHGLLMRARAVDIVSEHRLSPKSEASGLRH